MVLTIIIPEVEILVDLVVEDLKHRVLLVLEILHQLHQLRDILDQEIGMLVLAVVEVLEDLTPDILAQATPHLHLVEDRKIKFQVV